MGAGGDIPVALKVRACATLLSVVLAGCIDFEEPDFSEAGQPAAFQAIVLLDETGRLDVSGVLIPGITSQNVRRTVPNDTIRVYGVAIGPDETARNGSRTYDLETQLTGPEPGARPLTIVPPAVVGAVAPLTAIQWQGLRRLDPDTLLVAVGSDITLHVEVTPTSTNPAPTVRSWNVDLVSADSNFRFGANGVPPASIRIPSFWIPNASNGRIAVFLSFFQSGTYRPPPGDYAVSATGDVRIRWNVRLLPSPQP